MGKTQSVIVDTGPLVALLDKTDNYHAWAVEQVERLIPPMLVCEAVLSETLFLLAQNPKAQIELLLLLEKGVLHLAFHLEEHVKEVLSLLKKYQDMPMSLADACMVRMAEVFDHHCIFTLDSDFIVYRKHSRAPLKLIRPKDR